MHIGLLHASLLNVVLFHHLVMSLCRQPTRVVLELCCVLTYHSFICLSCLVYGTHMSPYHLVILALCCPNICLPNVLSLKCLSPKCLVA